MISSGIYYGRSSHIQGGLSEVDHAREEWSALRDPPEVREAERSGDEISAHNPKLTSVDGRSLQKHRDRKQHTFH